MRKSRPIPWPPVEDDVQSGGPNSWKSQTESANAGIKPDAAVSIASFIREYQGGEWFFVTELSVADGKADVAIMSNGRAREQVSRVVTDKTGVDPKTVVHLVSARQCPAIDAVREISKAGAPKPASPWQTDFALRRHPRRHRASLPAMPIDPLLIDHQGVPYKLRPKPKSPGAVYDYEIKGITVELARNDSAKFPWLVLAFSSPGLLKSFDGLGLKDTVRAEALMPKLQDQISRTPNVSVGQRLFPVVSRRRLTAIAALSVAPISPP